VTYAGHYITNPRVINPMSTPRSFVDKICPVRAKRERRKEARPGELLAAALDLFVEKGFAATRSEEVAARAGVSKGTLFLYFPSKEELFKAVVMENLGGRFTEWNAEFEAFEGTTADMLRYCMRVWWERVGMTKASGLTKLMMSEGANFPELAEFYRQEVIRLEHALEHFAGEVRKGVGAGHDRCHLVNGHVLHHDHGHDLLGEDVEGIAGDLGLLDESLETILELAFHARASLQQREVERADGHVAQRRWHVVVSDA